MVANSFARVKNLKLTLVRDQAPRFPPDGCGLLQMTYSEDFWAIVTCKISGLREAVMHALAPYHNVDSL